MKILVLDIAASKTGALSVLRDFYAYVQNSTQAADGGNDPSTEALEWIFVTGAEGILESIPDKKISVIVRDDVKASSAARLKFELFSGGKWINKISADIVFSLENLLPRGIDSKTKQVLYVHQPVGFQHKKRFSLTKPEEKEQAIYQKFYHPLIISSAKRADRVIVQTEWMREAMIRNEGIPEDKVYKVMPDIPDLSGFVKSGEFEPGRFFYPASALPYKNHAVIEKARQILEGEGLNPQIKYTKDKVLPREEVFAEYNRSTLLFPSYLETFGMPLGEAQQFGNPILAADTDFAREVLAGYDNAYFFDAFNASELAGLMRRVMKVDIKPTTPVKTSSGANSYSELVDIIQK